MTNIAYLNLLIFMNINKNHNDIKKMWKNMGFTYKTHVPRLLNEPRMPKEISNECCGSVLLL